MVHLLGLILYIALVWVGFYFGVIRLFFFISKNYIKENHVWLIILLTLIANGVISIIFDNGWPLIKGLFQ